MGSSVTKGLRSETCSPVGSYGRRAAVFAHIFLLACCVSTPRNEWNLQQDQIYVSAFFFSFHFNQMSHLISHAQPKKPYLLTLANVRFLCSVAINSKCGIFICECPTPINEVSWKVSCSADSGREPEGSTDTHSTFCFSASALAKQSKHVRC